VLGERHSSTLSSLEGLGQTMRRGGKLAEAEPILREALSAQKEINGAESSRYAAAADSLANLLHDMGRVSEARTFYEEAVSVMEKTPENATSIRAAFYTNNLASAHEEQCDFAAAEKQYRKSIAIRKTHWKREDAGVLRTELNLARQLNRAGRHADALEVLREVVAIRERILPEGHFDIFDSRLTLLETQSKLGNLDAARSLWQKVAAQESRLSGARKINFLRIGAVFRLATGETASAQALLKTRWDVQVMARGAEHTSALAAKLDYADALFRTDPAQAAALVKGLNTTYAKALPIACGVAARIERIAALN
jgi:serine/threonine-protein kinase